MSNGLAWTGRASWPPCRARQNTCLLGPGQFRVPWKDTRTARQAGRPGWRWCRWAGGELSGRMKMPLEQTAIVVQAFFDDLSIADFQDRDDGDGNDISAPGGVSEGALKGSESTIC